MIRLVAIDLDGTLFDPDKRVTPGVRAALQRALDAGIRVAIITGRGRLGANAALDLIGLHLPSICSAGALVRTNGNEISARAFHQPEELNRVIAFARKQQVGLIAEGPEYDMWFGPDWISDNLDPLTAKLAWSSKRTYEPEREFDRPLFKVTIATPEEIQPLAWETVLRECPTLNKVISGARYIDLTGRDVHKGSALKILAEAFGLQAGEVAAIGDMPIDLPMLEYAGLPIVMGNAPETIRQAGRWVAPANDQDGVAWALDKIRTMNAEG
jgi:Cof subfamily protein (haloacid dehalogenase superfamily)